jgi:hypothetical protein
MAISAAESVMWLVRAPGCPLKIVMAKNHDEKIPAKPLNAATVRREYEHSFAKRNSEAFGNRDDEWPTFEPITEADIQARELQWMTEVSAITGRQRAVHVVYQGSSKARVVKANSGE